MTEEKCCSLGLDPQKRGPSLAFSLEQCRELHTGQVCVRGGGGSLPGASQDRVPASSLDLLSIVPGWDRKHFLFPIACVD